MQRRSIAALMISLLLLSACGHGAGERSFQTFRDTLTGSLVTVTAQVRADYGDTVADYTLTCRELADGYDLTVIAPRRPRVSARTCAEERARSPSMISCCRRAISTPLD